jgi:GGDEF domain-containing protein
MTIVLAVVLSVLALLLIAALSLLLRRYVEEHAEEIAHTRVSSALTAVNARIETASRQVEAAEEASRRPPAASVAAAWEPFAGVLELDKVFRLTLETAGRLDGVDAASIWLEGIEEEPVVATLGLSPEEASRQAVALPPDGREARSVSVYYRHPPSQDGAPQLQTGVGVPLPLAEVGFLTVFSRSGEHEFGEDDVTELELIAARAAPAIESARRFRELRQLAEVDPLTQLGNRRSFEEDLAREIARARRYGRRLALVVLDLDSRLDGERVLASVAGCVREAVRRTDASYRIGDSELALIMPESGLGDAERLCRRLAHTLARTGANGRTLNAAGLAELARHDDEESLLRRAVATQGRSQP